MIFHPNEVDQRCRIKTAQIRANLASRIEDLAKSEGENATPLPDLTFSRLSGPTAPMAYLYEPCISMIVRGKKRVHLGKNIYIYDESRFLLTAVNLPATTEVLEARPEAPYLSLLLRLDLQVARRIMADVDVNVDGVDRRPKGPAMATGPATIELFDAICRLVNILENSKALSHLGDLIKQEIIYRILDSSAGIHFRQTVILGTQSQRTARAVEWIRDNFSLPLKIADLADMANMGTSTLHRHFRSMTSMSPLQYQKHLRLHEARRIILAESIDATTAALRVGYESISQFNREYRRMFGAPPIKDTAALRNLEVLRPETNQ